MTRNRQAAVPDEGRITIRSLALGLPSGFRLPGHAHAWPQLLYATEGVLTVTVGAPDRGGTWVVPSHRAAWIPGGVDHHLEAAGPVLLRTLYLRPDLAAELPTACCVMAVTPLLRELVLETIARGMLRDDMPDERRLGAVLVDQLAATREVLLDLRSPRDQRARRVADAVQADLSADVSLEQLAATSGASVRTLERLFALETGTTFGRWRQRARLLHALRLLASGESVTAVSLAVGYDSTSAFIAMFKRALGTTPGAHFTPDRPATATAVE